MKWSRTYEQDQEYARDRKAIRRNPMLLLSGELIRMWLEKKFLRFFCFVVSCKHVVHLLFNDYCLLVVLLWFLSSVVLFEICKEFSVSIYFRNLQNFCNNLFVLNNNWMVFFKSLVINYSLKTMKLVLSLFNV